MTNLDQQRREAAAVLEAEFADSAAGKSIENRAPRPLPVWLAISAIVLVAIDLRPGIVSIGPVLNAIRQDFGLDHAFASLLTTIPDLLMGLLAFPTPWLAQRFGRDRVLLAALTVLCGFTAARAFAHSPIILLACTAGVGAGIAIAGSLVAGFIKANFPTKAAILMGIYATSLSLGSTVSAAATGPLAEASPAGWRFGTGIWSVLGISAILAWTVITVKEGKVARTTRGTASRHQFPIKDGLAWKIALFFAANNFLFYALLAWTAPIFRENGFSPAKSGLLLASFTAAFMCGNPVFGALSRSHDRRGWLAVSGILTSLGLIPLAVAPMQAPFLWIPLAAFGLGGGFTLGMTLPLDNTHSVEEANVWNAFTLTVGYLIAAAGPLAVGALRDATGSFSMAIWVLVAIAAVMLLLATALRPRQLMQVKASRSFRAARSN